MSGQGESWRTNLIRDPVIIQQLALQAKRVAVLGIKTEDKASQPAFFVPAYLQAAGVEVVPVPVFYPDVTHILGQQVYRKVADVPGEIDILDVFRKPSDIPQHLDDILAAAPKAVWLQSGISHPAVEEQLARAGIKVVSDRCLKVDHQQAAMHSKM
eukprot:GHRQ01013499.1.p2 GENE.GHRQ01013499.1~~GHRQ01013499.1.p2  ORF type:complete len:156 (+),score=69.91 GHRQ01013499.1:475-942(+)